MRNSDSKSRAAQGIRKMQSLKEKRILQTNFFGSLEDMFGFQEKPWSSKRLGASAISTKFTKFGSSTVAYGGSECGEDSFQTFWCGEARPRPLWTMFRSSWVTKPDHDDEERRQTEQRSHGFCPSFGVLPGPSMDASASGSV